MGRLWPIETERESRSTGDEKLRTGNNRANGERDRNSSKECPSSGDDVWRNTLFSTFFHRLKITEITRKQKEAVTLQQIENKFRFSSDFFFYKTVALNFSRKIVEPWPTSENEKKIVVRGLFLQALCCKVESNIEILDCPKITKITEKAVFCNREDYT